MGRRAEWRRVLDAEVARWSEIPCEQLVKDLHEEKAYHVDAGARQFQVEVTLVENTADYVHVVVSVDDGRLPWSICPVTRGFITKKGKTE
jgi:hypothetical protein